VRRIGGPAVAVAQCKANLQPKTTITESEHHMSHFRPPAAIFLAMPWFGSKQRLKPEPSRTRPQFRAVDPVVTVPSRHFPVRLYGRKIYGI
jgi:hypothetical protein